MPSALSTSSPASDAGPLCWQLVPGRTSVSAGWSSAAFGARAGVSALRWGVSARSSEAMLRRGTLGTLGSGLPRSRVRAGLPDLLLAGLPAWAG